MPFKIDGDVQIRDRLSIQNDLGNGTYGEVLRFENNVISTEVTDGDIQIAPNGSGDVYLGLLSSNSQITNSTNINISLDTIGTIANSDINITTSGTGAVKINGMSISSGLITSSITNSSIELRPNGTGILKLGSNLELIQNDTTTFNSLPNYYSAMALLTTNVGTTTIGGNVYTNDARHLLLQAAGNGYVIMDQIGFQDNIMQNVNDSYDIEIRKVHASSGTTNKLTVGYSGLTYSSTTGNPVFALKNSSSTILTMSNESGKAKFASSGFSFVNGSSSYLGATSTGVSIMKNSAASEALDVNGNAVVSGNLVVNGTISDINGILAANIWNDVNDGINYANGNVGVGTSSILSKFTVNGGSTSNQNNETFYHGIALITGTGGQSLYMGYDNSIDGAYMNVSKTGSVQPLCLQTTGGKVGIGKTNPSEILDITGNAAISGNIVSNGSLTAGTGLTVTTGNVVLSNGDLTLSGAIYQNGIELKAPWVVVGSDINYSSGFVVVDGDGLKIETKDDISTKNAILVSNTSENIFKVRNDGHILAGKSMHIGSGHSLQGEALTYTYNATTETTTFHASMKNALYDYPTFSNLKPNNANVSTILSSYGTITNGLSLFGGFDGVSGGLYFYGKVGNAKRVASITSSSLFTGQHQNYIDEPFAEPAYNAADYIGLIMVSTGKNAVYKDGKVLSMARGIDVNDTLPVLKLSRTRNCKAVFGVATNRENMHNDRNDYDYNDGFCTDLYGRIRVNGVGEGGIWVCNVNGSFENGDYITTCEIPGYGMKQNDDLLHNYTVAKITMDCAFSDTVMVYKTLNVQEQDLKYYRFGEVVLNEEEYYDLPEKEKQKYTEFTDKEYVVQRDTNGYLQWVSESGMETPYKLRYLLPDGTLLSKEEYDECLSNGMTAYIAAFVGCTYHCG